MTEPGHGDEHRYAVVVAGGSGTRLWPMSRQGLPKQMQALMSDRSLIADTVVRLEGLLPADRIFVSTTQNYADQIRGLLPQLPTGNIIVEPEARGTPAAFALLAQFIHDRDPEATIFTLASDHAVTEIDEFQRTLATAYDFIDTHPLWFVIVGIAPSRPDTGLGYIKVSAPAAPDSPVMVVDKYVEKPSLEVARGYVRSGDYYWNSAYYCFRADTLIEAYADASAELVSATRSYLDTGDPEAYRKAPVMVHEVEIIDTHRYPLALVPGDFYWSDIGNWAALHRTLTKLDSSKIIAKGPEKLIDVDSEGCLVFGDDGRMVVTAGLSDVAIVSTKDALLVVNMQKLEQAPETMKTLLQQLAERGQEDLL